MTPTTPVTKYLALTMRSLLPLAAGVAIALATIYPLAANHSLVSAQQYGPLKLYVVPDLAERVAKFKQVHMAFNAAGLSAREKDMVAKLVDASGLLDCIYWRQNDPQALRLYLNHAKNNDPQDQLLRRYLKINGSRFDLIDDDKPFVGTQPMPPGRGFYLVAASPASFARGEIEDFVKRYPG